VPSSGKASVSRRRTPATAGAIEPGRNWRICRCPFGVTSVHRVPLGAPIRKLRLLDAESQRHAPAAAPGSAHPNQLAGMAFAELPPRAHFRRRNSERPVFGVPDETQPATRQYRAAPQRRSPA
jgi:hypothetical protein